MATYAVHFKYNRALETVDEVANLVSPISNIERMGDRWDAWGEPLRAQEPRGEHAYVVVDDLDHAKRIRDKVNDLGFGPASVTFDDDWNDEVQFDTEPEQEVQRENTPEADFFESLSNDDQVIAYEHAKSFFNNTESHGADEHRSWDDLSAQDRIVKASAMAVLLSMTPKDKTDEIEEILIGKLFEANRFIKNINRDLVRSLALDIEKRLDPNKKNPDELYRMCIGMLNARYRLDGTKNWLSFIDAYIKTQENDPVFLHVKGPTGGYGQMTTVISTSRFPDGEPDSDPEMEHALFNMIWEQFDDIAGGIEEMASAVNSEGYVLVKGDLNLTELVMNIKRYMKDTQNASER